MKLLLISLLISALTFGQNVNLTHKDGWYINNGMMSYQDTIPFHKPIYIFYKGNTKAEITPDTVALKKKYAALAKKRFSITRRKLGEIIYQQPIYITKPGTYTGNYKSDDPNTPAILILCYDSVIITACNIVSQGEGIKAYGGSRLNIHHNNIKGVLPTNGSQYGRALNDYQPQTLTFENNYVEHTGGLMVDHNNENTKSAIIRYNLIRNTDKRKTDGSAGDHRAATLFNTVTTIAGEIAWNKFENVVDSSFIEDNINLGNTGGTSTKPISIHDNFIKGAYPAPRIYPGAGQVDFSGSGITVEDNGGVSAFDQVSRYVNVTNNQVVSVGNGGINVNAGHDISVTGNRIISSGMYPDGMQSNAFWGAGACWNGSGLPITSFFNVVYKNNTVGYARPDQNTVYKGQTLKGRNDWVQVPGSPYNINPDDNISLPNPITMSTELKEDTIWTAKLIANRITIGNGVNNPVITPPGPPITNGTIVKAGQSITGIINPVDTLGNYASYKARSVTVSSDALTKVVKDSTNELSFTVTGIIPGVSNITVTLITNSGKTVSKTVQVTVTPNLPEVVDLVIMFK